MNDQAMVKLLLCLGLARRSGELLIGQDSIKFKRASQEGLLVVFAEAGSSFYRSCRRGSDRGDFVVVEPPGLSVENLSAAVGSRKVKVVALPLRSGLAQRILQLLAEGGESDE